ncbi:glycerophosphodiester phosphodiesterase [Streptomyces sp. NA02950]|uniref:glycerophosphodiester phosphodiesterase n=1 Tax=Streptomyces sp. NA02950 TaxID=2742137 RepID=UPI001590DE9B|nr:glycerophosphodiester phosphodiesterase [Streptomyces sp. NA02950]QKV92280.1 glycerophosphodiester phosphodiesterase [Streptomyces sp. NA02950]
MTAPGGADTADRGCVPVGHRGDPYVHRENTLASVRSAVRAGAGAVEIDVRLTRDGVPVLLHDATLNRLWGHDRPLSGLTADQVRELTGGAVPTLRDALASADSARLLIDLPDAAAAPAAVDEVRASGAHRRVYYCGALAALHTVRRADPDAEIALTWTTLAPPRPELLTALRPRWLNYRFGLVSEELVTRNHADGLLVSAWTADTRRSMSRLLRAGVDAITTNRVGALCALLGRR